jgi:hypothetical protein
MWISQVFGLRAKLAAERRGTSESGSAPDEIVMPYRLIVGPYKPRLGKEAIDAL